MVHVEFPGRGVPEGLVDGTVAPEREAFLGTSGYDLLDNVTVRAGVINLTDKEPSYPAIAYGDILGRRFFIGANVRF